MKKTPMVLLGQSTGVLIIARELLKKYVAASDAKELVTSGCLRLIDEQIKENQDAARGIYKDTP